MDNDQLESLWEDALPLVKIPSYPSFEYRLGTGKEWTYSAQETSHLMKIERRLADKDERLLDVDLKYIPDYSKNLKYRVELLQLARDNLEYQELQRIFCKSSLLYFVNTFCWTYDPRLKNTHIPFVTYPFQDELLRWVLWLMSNHEMGVIEKSRDMGATWCMEVIAVYMVLFFPGIVDYQLSLREEDVDNRCEDSLFGKVRYLLRNIPLWLRGGWEEKAQDIDLKMNLKIPKTGSLIRGQLTGGTAARSGRSTRALYDEFAFVDDSDKVFRASTSLTSCPIFLSTANGMGNMFYQKAHDPHIRKRTLHWSLHPMKNPLWATKERLKSDEESWASEQEINYSQSTRGRVYKHFISFSSSPERWTHLQEGSYFQYDPNYLVDIGMDLGISDPTSIVFTQTKPAPVLFQQHTKTCLIVFKELEASDKIIDDWIEILQALQWSTTNIEGFRWRHIVGDNRTGKQRSPTGITWTQAFYRHGLSFVGKSNSEIAPIVEVQRLLAKPGAFAINRHACPHLIKSFQNWSYPMEKGTGLILDQAKPLHNRWSHSMKAMAYLVDYLYGQTLGLKDPNQNEYWDFRVLNHRKYL